MSREWKVKGQLESFQQKFIQKLSTHYYCIKKEKGGVGDGSKTTLCQVKPYSSFNGNCFTALWKQEDNSPKVEPLSQSGTVRLLKGETVDKTNLLLLMGWWGRRSKMEMVSKQERQENWNSRLFVFPQEEEMFWLDIFCKLQQALKSMFDAGHFVSPQPSSQLSLTHSLGVYSVCLFVQLLLYAGSHYCSLSRPGLIVSHLTSSELCTKLAACSCRVDEEGWRIPQQKKMAWKWATTNEIQDGKAAQRTCGL